MNTVELVESLKGHAFNYASKGIEKSLKRNCHMNRYSQNPEPIETTAALNLIRSLIHYTIFTSFSNIEILKQLTDAATSVRTRINPKSSDPSRALAFKHQATIDAILVDFINYVGVQKGIDYALYTQNIETPSDDAPAPTAPPASPPTIAVHFNQLHPAQAELLALLAEECAEVIHAVTKILRHGLESHNPADPCSLTNAEALNRECGHITSALYLLKKSGLLSNEAVTAAGAEKLHSIKKWLHHVDLDVS